MLPLVIAVALVIIAIVLLPHAIASARGRFALRACVLHYGATTAAALLDAVRPLGTRE
jgi:hypothetical protein